MKTRIFIMPIAALLFSSIAAYAQLSGEFNPPRSNCCLANTAKSLADQLQDWNQLGRYYQANEQLKKQPPEPKRVVFMGRSEEHTSELQSLRHLVCRLLLEKKK